MAEKKPPSRDIERTVLENGARIISERIPDAVQTATGVWVTAGSRYEDLKESGATHLIQRLAFYAAGERSESDVANAVDSLGGKVDTEAGRDYGVYLARTAPDDLEPALSLLADLSLRSKVTKAGLAAERKKLLEDLRAAEKDPEQVLEWMFFRSLWKGHGLCRPPRGRLLTIKGQTRLEDFKPRALQRFHSQSHHPKAITVAIAGDVDHAAVRQLAEKAFGAADEASKTVSTVTPTAYKFLALRNRPQFSKVYFQLGVPACGAADEQRHAGQLLNAILGGGAGSRIAKLQRTEALPAEEISSEFVMFSDVGCLSIKARAARKNAVEALETAVAELKRLALGEVDEEELERARATCRSQLLAALESPLTRIYESARQERYFGRLLSYEEEIEALEKVKPSDVKQLAAAWFAPHYLSLAVLGNLKGVNIKPKLLRW